MSAGADTKMGEVTASKKKFLVGKDENGKDAPEPVFVLRAQDPFAVNGILAYASHVEQQGASKKHVKAARDAAERLEKWQMENEDLVKKMPDS
jgi:hypothetical protein